MGQHEHSGGFLYIVFAGVFVILFVGVFLLIKGRGLQSETRDILEVTAIMVTVLSLGVTFALAVLAINAFGNHSEIVKIRQQVVGDQKIIMQKAALIEKMISIMPSAFEQMSETIDQDDEEIYFSLTHTRFFLKLLLSTNPLDQLDLCRDLIGSMQSTHSQEILTSARKICYDLLTTLPGEKKTIETLVYEADKILLEMRQENFGV